jgi:hypothetical protein
MAKGNRQSFTSNVTTKIQPLVTTAIHRDVLINDLAASVVFGQDVALPQTSTSSNITVDFTGKDRVDLTRTGGSLNITITGLDDGEVKYLLITKSPGQAVTFVGVTDITPIKQNANALNLVLYEIVRKGSYYFAKAWVENVKTATETIEGVAEVATQAESNALSVTNKMITPGRFPSASTTQRGISRFGTDMEADTGQTAYAANCYQLLRKYNQVVALNTALAARVTTLESRKQILASGTYDLGDPGSTAEFTIEFGITVTGAYKLFYSVYDSNGFPQDLVLGIKTETTTNAVLKIRELDSHIQDVLVHWFVLQA